jgi:hypothetical protein
VPITVESTSAVEERTLDTQTKPSEKEREREREREREKVCVYVRARMKEREKQENVLIESYILERWRFKEG